jgi:hypothetical protein
MKKNYILLFLLTLIFQLSTLNSLSQEVEKIKIKKEALFVKAEFDNVDFKVVAIDRYGNPHEGVVKSFTITYKENGQVYEAPVVGNTFPNKTINFLTRKKKNATKICLKNIQAENKEGHLEKLPDLCDVVIFPDCKNCKVEDPKKKG